MCRIFGFRSVLESQMHESLVSADNALGVQSQKHPDGWGIAYYVHNTPHVIKSDKAARDDTLYPTVSSVVSSNTVLAHIRKATLGDKTILNTHPFQYGPWVFAHNGNINNFKVHRPRLLQMISPERRKFILGTTDSELMFYILMDHAALDLNIFYQNLTFSEFFEKIREGVEKIIEVIGPCSENEETTDENYLTFIITNGKITIGHHGGKKMYYSTHKKQCIERSTCPHFNASCENESIENKVNHFLISSETLQTNNVWKEMKMGEFVGVDQDMNLHKKTL